MNQARRSINLQFDDGKSEPALSADRHHMTKMFNYREIRKLFFILLLTFLFGGCDGAEDSIVDPVVNDFNVTNITAPTTLKYTGSDTKLITSITFSDSKSILRTWINLDSQDGTVNIAYKVSMVKSGENVYSISIPMEEDMPSLNYTIDYYYQTEIQAEKKIASHNFEYDNSQNNVAPIISNPLLYYTLEVPILRDTLENDREIILSIEVTDENGLSDIDSVYTDFYSPSNPSALRVILFDDGDSDHGDAIAGDGIYSLKNIFQNAYGNRKFEFWARDRAGVLSNMITHNLVVK